MHASILVLDNAARMQSARLVAIWPFVDAHKDTLVMHWFHVVKREVSQSPNTTKRNKHLTANKTIKFSSNKSKILRLSTIIPISVRFHSDAMCSQKENFIHFTCILTQLWFHFSLIIIIYTVGFLCLSLSCSFASRRNEPLFMTYQIYIICHLPWYWSWLYLYTYSMY